MERDPTHQRRLAPRPVQTDDDPAALLARVMVAQRWATALPRVPAHCEVTVSFSHGHAVARYRAALQRRGYRVVGALHTARDSPAFADLLVEDSVARAHPAWWRQLRSQSAKVYNLRFGPAQALLADVLRLHLGQSTGG